MYNSILFHLPIYVHSSQIERRLLEHLGFDRRSISSEDEEGQVEGGLACRTLQRSSQELQMAEFS